MGERVAWKDMRGQVTEETDWAYGDEARVSEFQEMVYRLRTEAGLTRAELAERMGTTQSAVVQMEDGGTRPTLATLKLLVIAVGQEEVGRASN